MQIRSSRAALVLALVAAGCGERDHGPFRHVVMISLDTTRADHLQPYGAERPTTARIAALAERGVLFEQVLSPAPTTLSAHTSIMTGSYPQTHGVARNGFVVHEENVMLAELLAAQGFHTAAILGSFALESGFSFDQGFDTFDEEFDVEAYAEPGLARDQNQRRADSVTEAALACVDRVDAERRFLFVHYFDAHQPYEPPPPYNKKWAEPGELQSATGQDVGRSLAEHTSAILGEPASVSGLATWGLDARLIEEADGKPRGVDQQLANLYAGEVAFIDDQIARLLDGLDQRGLLEDALIILTGDHGETFWEHGDHWNHGLWVYETTVHVPLILCLPDGRGAGTRVATPVSTIDIVPTLCDLLDIEAPARSQGMSLVPALDGRPLERGPVFSQATQPWKVEAGSGVWLNSLKPRCVRQGPWKYVQAPYLAESARLRQVSDQPGLEQLFDLREDPGERRNLLRSALSADAASAYAELRQVLDGWSSAAAPLPGVFNPEQSAEIIEKLKGLGYFGAAPPEPDEDR